MSTDLAPLMPSRPEILAATLSTLLKAKGFWLPTTTASISSRRTGLSSNISLTCSASSTNVCFSRCWPLYFPTRLMYDDATYTPRA